MVLLYVQCPCIKINFEDLVTSVFNGHTEYRATVYLVGQLLSRLQLFVHLKTV